MPDIDQAELDHLNQRAEAGDTAAAALEKSQTDLAGLQGAGERADAATAALLDQTRNANPTIPPALITGDDPEAITASVQVAQATVAQVQELNPPEDKTKPPPRGNAGTPPRGQDQPPEGARGIARISHALSHPGPGNTEV
jgi:hypothetical protein